MSTIDVQGQYLVHAGDSLTFTGETGFAFVAQTSGDPSVLIVRGAVSAAFADGGPDSLQTAVLGDTDQGPAVLDIRAGASLSISAAPGDGDLGAVAFVLAASGSRVVNHGLVGAEGDVAATVGQISGIGSHLLNAGNMSATGDVARGLVVGGVDVGLANSGSITVTGGASAFGVLMLGEAVLHNSGDLTVQAEGAAYAVAISSGMGEVRNSGTIRATGGEAVGIEYNPGVAAHRLVNSGLIAADRAIVVPDPLPMSLRLINSGEIDGAVQLGGDTDVVRNTGTMIGDIDLGGWQDVYDGSHGLHTGAVYGAGGNDRLYGGDGDDDLWGDRRMADHYDGADLLKGGGGDDSLHGGGGADTVWGGAGADQLHGGAGADVFVYAKASDSVAGHADYITDLEAADRIDLSAIDADATTAGDQAFVLVLALDGHAGQAALSYDAGADLTTLALDIDGDGAADSLIHLAGDQTGFGGLVL